LIIKFDLSTKLSDYRKTKGIFAKAKTSTPGEQDTLLKKIKKP